VTGHILIHNSQNWLIEILKFQLLFFSQIWPFHIYSVASVTGLFLQYVSFWRCVLQVCLLSTTVPCAAKWNRWYKNLYSTPKPSRVPYFVSAVNLQAGKASKRSQIQRPHLKRNVAVLYTKAFQTAGLWRCQKVGWWRANLVTSSQNRTAHYSCHKEIERGAHAGMGLGR